MVARQADFHLPPELAAQILSHALDGFPEEVCGLITGRDGRAVAVHPGRNGSPTPRVAYEMDVETLTLQLEFEEAGLELLGIYHSHPDGPFGPSATDITQCAYPDAIYLIVDMTDLARPAIGAFRIEV